MVGERGKVPCNNNQENEEEFLRNKFGSDYTSWATCIPAFIPSFKQFVKNPLPYKYKNIIRREYTSLSAMIILILLLIAVMIGSIPLFLWEWQTGNWIVYSYGDEGFDFTNPQISNFLFSYLKGWFIYTPMALFILLPGLFYLYKKSIQKAILAVVFYCTSIYIFSSWWCWYYGAGMSQRVMIDHYILLGFLMLLTFQYAPKLLQRCFIISCGFLLVFNIVQAAQIQKGIYKMGSPTKEMYWDNFLNLTLKAKVYQKSEWQVNEEKSISFHPIDGCLTKGVSKKEEVEYFIQTNPTETFSPTFLVKLKHSTHRVVVSFNTLAKTEVLESRLILNTKSEVPQTKIIYLKEFVVLNSKTQMEYLIEFDIATAQFEAYFWNGNTDELVDYSNFKVISYE